LPAIVVSRSQHNSAWLSWRCSAAPPSTSTFRPIRNSGAVGYAESGTRLAVHNSRPGARHFRTPQRQGGVGGSAAVPPSGWQRVPTTACSAAAAIDIQAYAVIRDVDVVVPQDVDVATTLSI
jgi:hypothetical protein